jgi:hypothetical protein
MAPTQEHDQFDYSIDEQAKPQIDECAPVHQVSVPGPRRQTRRQPKVNGIACDNGNQILNPARALRSHSLGGGNPGITSLPASAGSKILGPC